MAGTTIRMTAKKENSLQIINNKIRNIKGAECVSEFKQIVNDVVILTLIYEKYYMRTGGYTSLSIVLTEYEQQQTAYIVASGGGEGIVNHSFGANRNFAKECVEVLELCGFNVIESDLENKGFFDRFIK